MPLFALAQQAGDPKTIGCVWMGARGDEFEILAGLRRGLEDRGYVFGRNLVLDERYANGNAAQVPQLIAELLRSISSIGGGRPAAALIAS